MLWTLTKANICGIFSGYNGRKREKTKKKAAKNITKILIGLFVILCIGLLEFSIFSLFSSIADTLGSEYGWFYFVFCGIAGLFLMIIGSVYAAKNAIFEPKDNDLLLSMPIPSSYILFSRMIGLFILNYVFGAIIFIPAGIAYAGTSGFTFAGAVCYIINCILIGFLSMAVICLLAYIMEAVSSRVKNKSLATTLLSLAFLGIYFYVYFNIGNIISYITANSESVADSVRKYAFPAYHLGVSAASGSFLSLFFFALSCLIPFAIVYFILSKRFISLATRKTSSKTQKGKYKEKELSVSSVGRALFVKELRYFFSVPAYILNAGIGLILAVGLSVYAAIKLPSLYSVISELGITDMNIMGYIMIAALMFICSMNTISASSISLEGNRLWIAKSLPVSVSDILLSKVRVHSVICVIPMAISGIVLWAGLKLSWYVGILTVLTPCIYSVLIGYIGVLLNLKMPKLNWTNEAVPVKQGGAAFVTMIISYAVSLVTCLLGYVFFKYSVSLVYFFIPLIAIFILLCCIFEFLIKDHTEEVFKSL